MDNYLYNIEEEKFWSYFGACRECGALNPLYSRFCRKCGKAIDEYQTMLHEAIRIVKDEIKNGTENESSMFRAARDVVTKFVINDNSRVKVRTILAGLVNEFSDHEFPMRPMQTIEQHEDYRVAEEEECDDDEREAVVSAPRIVYEEIVREPSGMTIEEKLRSLSGKDLARALKMFDGRCNDCFCGGDHTRWCRECCDEIEEWLGSEYRNDNDFNISMHIRR